MKKITFIVIVLAAMGCDDCCNELSDGNSLQGKWQLVEIGYSPGAGYVTEKIEDRIFLEFGSDHKFTSDYEGLEDINFYQIIEESDMSVLELFPTVPNENDPDQLAYKYYMSFDDNMLKLMYAYCIEGCHLGIEKIN